MPRFEQNRCLPRKHLILKFFASYLQLPFLSYKLKFHSLFLIWIAIKFPKCLSAAPFIIFYPGKSFDMASRRSQVSSTENTTITSECREENIRTL